MNNYSFWKKHPYITAILAALLCTFITAFGSALPQIIGLPERKQMAVTSIFLAFSALIGFFILHKSNTFFSNCGLCSSSKNSRKKVWWYIPLFLIEVFPLLFYPLSKNMGYIDYLLLLFFTICVGFNEEVYFRGIVLSVLKEKSIKAAIAGSAFIFSILHIINALNGKNFLYLVLQVLFAFLTGIVLAEIVFITKSLWIVILWHTLHDFISMSTGDALDVKALILLAIQICILIVYAQGIRKSLATD